MFFILLLLSALAWAENETESEPEPVKTEEQVEVLHEDNHVLLSTKKEVVKDYYRYRPVSQAPIHFVLITEVSTSEGRLIGDYLDHLSGEMTPKLTSCFGEERAEFTAIIDVNKLGRVQDIALLIPDLTLESKMNCVTEALWINRFSLSTKPYKLELRYLH